MIRAVRRIVRVSVETTGIVAGMSDPIEDGSAVDMEKQRSSDR